MGAFVNHVKESGSFYETQSNTTIYKLIAENIMDMVSVWDPFRRARYVSPSHEKWLGYTCEYLQENLREELFHPDDIHMVMEKLDRLLVDGQTITIEFRLRHAKGHWLALAATMIAVRDHQGDKITSFAVIARDITQSKEAEERLRLTEKLLAVGELAAGVAHEIRNPLTTLKGFIQFIREGNKSEMYLDLMESELDRIETITHEFLLLAKPQVYECKPIRAEQLMENVHRLLIAQANLFNIELIMKVESNLPMIMCAENAIKQVFINLIKNAIEAMPNGGRIMVEVMRLGTDDICVYIRDEGCGIEKDRIAKLGQPFYSLKEEGSGLGLMVCSKIIKEHNGTIEFISELGKGTTVEITLPIFGKQA